MNVVVLTYERAGPQEENMLIVGEAPAGSDALTDLLIDALDDGKAVIAELRRDLHQ